MHGRAAAVCKAEDGPEGGFAVPNPNPTPDVYYDAAVPLPSLLWGNCMCHITSSSPTLLGGVSPWSQTHNGVDACAKDGNAGEEMVELQLFGDSGSPGGAVLSDPGSKRS